MDRSRKPAALSSAAVKPAEPTANVQTTDDGKVIATLPNGDSVEILFYGATILSWKVGGGKKEVFWLSSKAKLDGSKAVRGGIPVVFPVFGKVTEGPAAKLPQHGFARSSTWELLGKTDTESKGVQLDLGLSSDKLTEDFQELWPYKFALIYSITLTEGQLETSIQVRNEDDKKFDFNVLLHNYFKIDDVSTVSVEGVSSGEYTDKTTTPISTSTDSNSKVQLAKVTDRVYKNISSTVTISNGDKPAYSIERDGLPDVVVWNPWSDAAKGMSDFGPEDGWKTMRKFWSLSNHFNTNDDSLCGARRRFFLANNRTKRYFRRKPNHHSQTLSSYQAFHRVVCPYNRRKCIMNPYSLLPLRNMPRNLLHLSLTSSWTVKREI
jgi:glucose-6-phosphate 1-epimerase